MNIQNDFFFGSDARTLMPTMPVIIKTCEQAYRTAAWIEVMAVILPHEQEQNTFEEIREAIRNT